MNKNLFKHITAITLNIILLYSCASIGRPDGGPIDETPPKVVNSTPNLDATSVKKSKITINFDEYIKLENASQKVVVSPPQLQQPLIKPLGKKISITLQDSLIPNTTYTIDFGDAIVDNNEGNPLGEYTFRFSTGEAIDTMSIAGTVLEASNLEPIKNMLVGIQSNLNDTAFTSLPFSRISKTDSRGNFTIHGVAPGEYNIFALSDDDQNYTFSQKSEKIAFLNKTVIPTSKLAIKNDTIWKDSVTVDSIFTREYTQFLPNNIKLRAFKERVYNQYLEKSERKEENIITLEFAELTEVLPTVKGLNFDEKRLVADTRLPSDSIINYFVTDSILIQKDSLIAQIDYLHTDTLNQLVNKRDTILFYYKHKQTEKTKSKKDIETKNDSIIEKYLALDIAINSPIDVYSYINISSEIPIANLDSTKIHIYHKVDSLWQEVDSNKGFTISKEQDLNKTYSLFYSWKPGNSYKIEVDSAAFKDIYNLANNKFEKEFDVKKLDEYGSIEFNITNLSSQQAFIELLDTSDEVIRVETIKNNSAAFYYLNPGKYGARMVIDSNNNGKWDTGKYEGKVQPEEVYYYPQLIEFKANWSATQDWDILSTPLDQQKPTELKKQKPDEKKKKERKRR